MKILSILVFIGLTVIPISSCNKKSQTAPTDYSSLVGSWELRQITGFSGTKNYLPGNGSVVEFTGSSYSTTSPKDQIFIQGVAPSAGPYKIVADGTVNASTGLGFPAGEFTNRIILNDDGTANKLFYQVKGEQLLFVSGYFPLDGGVLRTYQRQ